MNLAIKGHLTRGKEVIQLLEMLGGENSCNLKGVETDSFYYICKDNDIYLCLSTNTENFIVFTLEEFEEKFPYKVGDKVTNEYRLPMIIFNMYWDSDFNVIKYNVRFLDDDKTVRTGLTTEDLQPYKEENYCQVIGNDTSSNGVDTSVSSINEETPEEPEPKAPILSNRYDYAEGKCGYVIPDGYEFDYIKEGFQTEIILKPKKPQYPKTYDECCEVLGILEDRGFGFINLSECENTLMSHFIQLKRCRDAYWKIAGDEMGLGKPWEPDWDNSSTPREFTKINKGRLIHLSRVLVFPTTEMRDAFYENFKDLINECKELL